MNYQDKNILILGLGSFGGGVEVTKYFAKQNAKVTVCDLKPKEQLSNSVKQLANYSINYTLGTNEISHLENYDLLVVNPAIPPDNNILLRAQKMNLAITTEVNLFFENSKAKIIAVVGTNGKGTVMNILGEMFKTSDKKYFIGGNIGSSLINVPDAFLADRTVLLELSSFQLARLKDIKRRPNIVILLNIQPDHLEWHKTFEKYVSDKLVVLSGQGKDSTAIINTDDKYLKQNVSLVEGRLIRISIYDFSGCDAGIVNQSIIIKDKGQLVKLANVNTKIVGIHNKLNQVLAAVGGWVSGIGIEAITKAIASYTGLENSLEFVSKINNISFYNDSEATNPDATISALNSFDEPIWLIAGGFDKKIDYSKLTDEISKRVKGVALIGQLTDRFYSMLSSQNHIKVFRAYDMKNAFKYIVSNANGNEVVLLSPGSSSYDQFENLEARAHQYKSLVAEFKSINEFK